MRIRMILVSAMISLLAASAVQAGKVDGNCTYAGKKLYGRIQVVSAFPDVKVQVVSSFPDLKVKTVENFPTKCGMWQMVESFPDTKVQFVNSFPDVKIQFVESFPGRVN